MDEKTMILKIIERIGNTPDKLIEILTAVQSNSKEHYIKEEQLMLISNCLKIPLSRVYGVATFYSMISTTKKGKYVIQICNSGPCYVKKSRNIIHAFEEALGIKIGETTSDGLFSMEYTSCFGACHIAPAVKINDEIYGNLDRDKVLKILTALRKEVT